MKEKEKVKKKGEQMTVLRKRKARKAQ